MNFSGGLAATPKVVSDRAADGEKELTEALKEMGIKKMGHRQAIVGAVMGK